MEDSFRPLATPLGRLFAFWVAWWFITVAVMLAAFAGNSGDLNPESWRGRAIVALLFVSGIYGTVMLLRAE